MVIVYKIDHVLTGSAKLCWAVAICFCFANGELLGHALSVRNDIDICGSKISCRFLWWRTSFFGFDRVLAFRLALQVLDTKPTWHRHDTLFLLFWDQLLKHDMLIWTASLTISFLVLFLIEFTLFLTDTANAKRLHSHKYFGILSLRLAGMYFKG